MTAFERALAIDTSRRERQRTEAHLWNLLTALVTHTVAPGCEALEGPLNRSSDIGGHVERDHVDVRVEIHGFGARFRQATTRSRLLEPAGSLTGYAIHFRHAPLKPAAKLVFACVGHV